MATVRVCPVCTTLCPVPLIDTHCDQWLGNETLRTVDDRAYERSCPQCRRTHDLTVAECCGESLGAAPIGVRRRAREVLLDLPWGVERVIEDTVLGRSMKCPFGASFASDENGRFVSRQHVTILFEDGVPMLRVERSRNSTQIDDVTVRNGSSCELTDGMTLRLSMRFQPIAIQVRDLA